jgi:hypothetical protein
MSLLGLLADGWRALEASSKRAASRRIPQQQRDEDCKAVVEALYRLWESKAPELPYKRLVKLLASVLDLTDGRVREALRQVADVRPVLVCAPSRSKGKDVVDSCVGCADPDDVCLLHGSAAALFAAALPPKPQQLTRSSAGYGDPYMPERAGYLPKSGSAGKVGFGPLKLHTTLRTKE